MYDVVRWPGKHVRASHQRRATTTTIGVGPLGFSRVVATSASTTPGSEAHLGSNAVGVEQDQLGLAVTFAAFAAAFGLDGDQPADDGSGCFTGDVDPDLVALGESDQSDPAGSEGPGS